MNFLSLGIAIGVGFLCSSAAFAQTCGPSKRCPPGWRCEFVPGQGQICIPPLPPAPPPPVGPLPQPTTDLSQAWTQINNIVYEFIVNREPGNSRFGHVEMVFFQVGTGSDFWIDLGAPPSSEGFGAITGPAATSVPGSGFIFLTVANRDGVVCLNQGHDFSWTGWNC